MAGGSAGLHEPADKLETETLERHRAIASLIEELEAVDWYAQRIDACSDPSLRAILAHNRDEEKEHACMTLEWLRRHDASWDAFLRRFLFSDGPITEVEEEGSERGQGASNGAADGSLRIGGLAAEAGR